MPKGAITKEQQQQKQQQQEAGNGITVK